MVTRLPLSRRALFYGACAAPWIGVAHAGSLELKSRIATLDRSSGGRLGVAVWDTGSGRRFAWRGEERFPLCSTFKFLLAAAVLQRIDRGQERGGRRVPVTRADLIDPSPVSEKYAGRQGAPVRVLLQAMMEFSDNAAANLMLASVGGPAALTRFMRTLGDPITRLDRNEPALNEAIPGDPRDTTTPNAMLDDLQRITLGDALSPASQAELIGWMKACQTGLQRLRAGLPAGWAAADKTGTNSLGTANDLAIAWPPGRKPVLITCYLTASTLPPAQQNAIHAEVAHAVARVI